MIIMVLLTTLFYYYYHLNLEINKKFIGNCCVKLDSFGVKNNFCAQCILPLSHIYNYICILLFSWFFILNISLIINIISWIYYLLTQHKKHFFINSDIKFILTIIDNTIGHSYTKTIMNLLVTKLKQNNCLNKVISTNE